MIRIKELREEKNLLQKDLAKALNSNQRTISNWENGLAQPNIESLILLADFFEVSIDFLVGRSDDFGQVTVKNPDLTDEESELLQIFRNVTDADRSAILTVFTPFKQKAQQKFSPPR